MLSSKSCVKVFCAVAVFGLTISALEINSSELKPQENITELQRPPRPPLWENWWCDEVEDGFKFPHPRSCSSFLVCQGGKLWEGFCDSGMIFDERHWMCLPANQGVCEDVVNQRCPPPGSHEIVFLESMYCENFYICIEGNPVQLSCRPGQHWNTVEQYCDDPERAGCEEHETVADCPLGFFGRLPHPTDCRKFFNCVNGRRSVGECSPLLRFDMISRRCVRRSSARCMNEN